MAGPIQLGDALRLAELAWKVYEYGWAPENNAGENYRAFGADVFTLAQTLERLEESYDRARRSLMNSGEDRRAILLEDQYCFSEIVGDYKETLNACYRLIDDNRRYAYTTGPFLNIDWHMNVMPAVDHLRERIQMHNSRLQHFLKPFEIDLITNFQGNMNRGMISIQSDVQRLQRHVEALIERGFPDVARAIQEREEQRLCFVETPDDLRDKFDQGFQRHESHRIPTLQDMTDCFLVYFGRSTVRLPVTHHGGGTPMPCPPSQYLALLKCQYLMDKVKTSPELQQSHSLFFWPGYVRALEESLEQQCARFKEELTVPELLDLDHEALTLWPTVERPDMPPTLANGPRHVHLLDIPLATEPGTTTWRTIQLFKQVGSAHRFRIIEDWGDTRLPKSEGPRIVDFDTRAAVLIPLYADPVRDLEELAKAERPPLELILEHNHASFKYVFRDLRSLLKFQETLTGYSVAGLHTQFHARAVFVRPRHQELSLKEFATVQLWMPKEEEVIPVRHRSDYGSTSSDSQYSSVPGPRLSQGRRAHSVSSSHSAATASSASQSSSIFEDTSSTMRREKGATASHATIRPIIRKPLLVIFVRDGESRSVVVINVDGETRPNPELCRCLFDKNCQISAIHQERGPSPNLSARRLGQNARWNLLSIPSRASEWEGLLRASILFPTVDARQKMGGTPCDCRIRKDLDVDKCLREGHQGFLGGARVWYRRQMIMRHEGAGTHQVISN